MSYKIKSLIYLICFVSSAVLYYNMDHGFNSMSGTHSTEVAKVDTNKVSIEKKVEAVEVQ